MKELASKSVAHTLESPGMVVCRTFFLYSVHIINYLLHCKYTSFLLCLSERLGVLALDLMYKFLERHNR